LGPSPLFHFLAEIERGANIQDTLETYGRLPSSLSAPSAAIDSRRSFT
jgi:hypothetical protein